MTSPQRREKEKKEKKKRHSNADVEMAERHEGRKRNEISTKHDLRRNRWLRSVRCSPAAGRFGFVFGFEVVEAAAAG